MKKKYKNARTERRTLFLESLTETIKKSPKIQITDSYLSDYAIHNDITKEEARIVHANAGGNTSENEEKQITTDDLKPISEIILEGAAVLPIEQGITKLKALKPNEVLMYPGLSTVTNLYEVLACLFKGTQEDYKKKGNAEIEKLINKYGIENAVATSETPAGIAKSLLAAAASAVFSSVDKRAKYEYAETLNHRNNICAQFCGHIFYVVNDVFAVSPEKCNCFAAINKTAKSDVCAMFCAIFKLA